MMMFLIQTAFLLAIAFVIGAIIGSLLKRIFASDDVTVPVTTAAVATAAAATAYVPKADPTPKPDPIPEPELAPAPVMPAASLVSVKPKASAKPKATAKPKAKAATAIPSNAKDDLKLIVGIGPVNERKLNTHGITTFAQIAGWKKPDIIDAEKYLQFDGRIEREEWVRQAKQLAAGRKSEDAAELGRQGKASSKGKPAPATVAKVPVKPAVSKASPIIAKAQPTAAKPAKAIASSKASGLMGDGSIKSSKLAAAPKATVKSQTKSANKPAVPKPTAAKKPMAAKLAKPIGGKPDNLTLINGIGNVIEKKLHGMGVFHFEQIANWTEQMAEEFSKSVGFPGRAKREGWMKEAGLFAKGGSTEHARKVEAGEIPSSRKSTAAEKSRK